jgi:hypothetical protein
LFPKLAYPVSVNNGPRITGMSQPRQYKDPSSCSYEITSKEFFSSMINVSIFNELVIEIIKEDPKIGGIEND